MWDSHEKGVGMWDQDPPSRPCLNSFFLTLILLPVVRIFLLMRQITYLLYFPSLCKEDQRFFKPLQKQIHHQMTVFG